MGRIFPIYLGIIMITIRATVLTTSDFGDNKDVGSPHDIGDQKDVGGPKGIGHPTDLGGPEEIGHPTDVGVSEEIGYPTDAEDPKDIRHPKGLGGPEEIGHPKDVGGPNEIGHRKGAGSPKDVGDTKIVGGVRANLVPFMVSVQRNGGHYCGASLLSLTAALSACHCVGELKSMPGGNDSYKVLYPFSPSNYLLQAGDWALYIANQHSQRRNAKAFFVHPKCAKVNGILEFDFSLISVTEPFTRTIFVRPTKMLFRDKGAYRKRLSEIIDNSKDTCWVMGWGKPESNPKNRKPITRFLKKAQMRFISDFQCQDLLGRHNPIFTYYDFNGRAQVCAIGVKFQDSDCTGDSGGPVWCRDHIMAIVSYGMPDCGRADEPAVYAKLEDFVEWYSKETLEIIHRGASTLATADGVTTIVPFVLCLSLHFQMNFVLYIFL